MRPPYSNPHSLARNALRMTTGRVAHGWWPRVYVMDLSGQWVVCVTLYNDQLTKKHDRVEYDFEFKATSKEVANDAARELHRLFFPTP